MKLTGLNPNLKSENNVQIKKTSENSSSGSAASLASAAEGADRVELSAGSLDVQKIKDVLAETPDVRIEKVKALKEQIERGQYSVDSREVADKMLISLLSENI